MTDWNAPVDAIHHSCVAARAAINRDFNELKARVVTWRPQPMPADFGCTTSVADANRDRPVRCNGVPGTHSTKFDCTSLCTRQSCEVEW